MVPASVAGNSEKVKGDFVEEEDQQCLGGYLVLHIRSKSFMTK